MIRLLVLDVDGTMTDGGVYYDATGNELKKFAIKDGAGLVLARTAGIRVMICTGRECEAVRRRAADLKITDIYQDVGKKAAFLRNFMAENGYARDDVAYCGDDLNDLAAMALCGFVACPADAAPEVRARALGVAVFQRAPAVGALAAVSAIQRLQAVRAKEFWHSNAPFQLKTCL